MYLVALKKINSKTDSQAWLATNLLIYFSFGMLSLFFYIFTLCDWEILRMEKPLNGCFIARNDKAFFR